MIPLCLCARNHKMQTADASCERTLAIAAPFTPKWKLKIHNGSKMILSTAPNTTLNIPIFPNPWAFIKLFMPKDIMTKSETIEPVKDDKEAFRRPFEDNKGKQEETQKGKRKQKKTKSNL